MGKVRSMLDTVRETVTRASLSASDQLAFLRSIGLPNGADEIALDLEYVLMVARTLAKEGEISEKAVEAISAIDQKFLEMTANKDLWSVEALRDSMHWEEARILAREALKLLPPATNQDNS